MSSVPARLIAAATPLFAARGYEGTSVRAICAAADTNLNAVNYHFGSKQELYAAVIRGVGHRRLASARRLLETPATTAAELETRLIIFAEETLVSWLEEPGVLNILLAELQRGFRNCGEEAMESLKAHTGLLVTYLSAAKEAGLLRDNVDVDMIAGGLTERLNNQVLHMDVLQEQHGTSVADPTHRRYWVRQVIELLLYGAIAP